MNQSPPSYRRRAFSLVELLVVVVILATLMAVALPLYLFTAHDAGKKSCRANMQTIASAAQAWKARTRAVDFSALEGTTMEPMIPDLATAPVCPEGGVYSIVTTGQVDDGTGLQDIPAGRFAVVCSIPGHDAYIPGKSPR